MFGLSLSFLCVSFFRWKSCLQSYGDFVSLRKRKKCLLLFIFNAEIERGYTGPIIVSLGTFVYILHSIVDGSDTRAQFLIIPGHRVRIKWQWPISGVHSIMMEKSALAGEGVRVTRPPPFTPFTITYNVAMYVPAERADTLPLFHLYLYMYSVV